LVLALNKKNISGSHTTWGIGSEKEIKIAQFRLTHNISQA